MTDALDLGSLFDRGQRLIAIDSFEDVRVLRTIRREAARLGWPAYRWSITDGLVTLAGVEPAPAAAHQPVEALKRIRMLPAGVFVLFDFHRHLSDPVVSRLLRDIAQEPETRICCLVGHRIELPAEFGRIAASTRLPALSRDEIVGVLREEVIALRKDRPQSELTGDADTLNKLVAHLGGLTASDVRLIARDILRDDGRLSTEDLDRVFRAKKAILGESGVLNMEAPVARLDDVAGMARLKAWLAQRAAAFAGDPGALGLDPPKGILLLGVQGCGKSMAAKAVAGAWHIPLLRIDFGSLYNKFLGETERNLRESLAMADAMAPCALWLDEIEKGLASSDADGGESRRLLGTLLTWMAERKSRVFMIATSNDIEQLPPELVRKGRFDEIFFVDLPQEAIRKDILRIHLSRRRLDPAGFDLDHLAQRTEGYSGAELEQAVVAALYAARAAGATPATSHVEAEIDRTKPLAVVMAEKIAWLRLWAKDRTVSAD